MYSRTRGQMLPISLVHHTVQAKITLGLNASADLNEITEETIHKHFMAKLQLVSESSQKIFSRIYNKQFWTKIELKRIYLMGIKSDGGRNSRTTMTMPQNQQWAAMRITITMRLEII